MQVRATEDTRLVSMPAEAYDAMWPHKENHYWYVRFLRDLPGFQKVASRTIALVYYTLSEKECAQGTKVVEQVCILVHTHGTHVHHGRFAFSISPRRSTSPRYTSVLRSTCSVFASMECGLIDAPTFHLVPSGR